MHVKQAKKHRRRGFTLIEIMVAVSIFAMVMVVGIGAVLSIVGANKKSQAFNSVITNLNFALEGMMRDLRTGYSYNCGSTGTPKNDCVSTPASSITFTSSQYAAQVKYELVSGRIYKKVGTGAAALLTSQDVTIDKLDFYVSGTAVPAFNPDGTLVAGSDLLQPKIVLVISGKYAGYGQSGRFNMQTTVSQRKLDIGPN